MTPLLEVHDLHLHYATAGGPVLAVDGMSLTLAGDGEVLGIIGESGSGKTSLALALLRLLPRNVARYDGSVRLNGVDLMGLTDGEMRRTIRWREASMVFQGAMNVLNPVIRVGRQITEPLLVDGGVTPREAAREAARLLEVTGLPGATAKRYPHELSGGMKQRVVIAMALVLRPRLVILDEPTSALDVSVQAQIMNLLKDLRRDLGLSMLFITHDIALASDLADRLLVVHAGAVLESGSAEQVLLTPREPFTRRLLASSPRLRPVGGATTRRTVPAAPEGSALLRVRDLAVHFAARKGLLRTEVVRAVDGVSLDLPRGVTIALVGESGSGKTTFGRATLRLVEAARGQVVFDGVDIATLSGEPLRAFRRRAQPIPQDPYASISPYMTVAQIVEEPLLVHDGRDGRRQRVLAALARVGLTAAERLADAYPQALSGGQRQRVAIARAMILEPNYLVADEPVSMIDASSRVEILSLLRDLQRARGLALLYITHDIATAHHFADQIAVMYLGRLVETGPAGAVVTEPLHPYTRALIAVVPEPDPANRHRRRQVVSGEPPDPTVSPPGCPFHPRCPDAIAGVCDRVPPTLQEIAPGRFVSCHLYG